MDSVPRALALTILLYLAGIAAAQPPDISLSQGDGVLVLRNGRVLRGRITPVGDHYLVTMGAGNEASLPAASVELACRDLEEAYQLKRAALRYGDAAAHRELAAWCLQQGLRARAADQLLALFACQPSHPELAGLEAWLRLPRRAAEGQEAAQRVAPAVGADELERLTDSIPPGAVERFTVAVQPVLINRCAASACHGPATTTQLELFRSSRGRALTRRMTQRNLHSVLQFVDRDQPGRSRLLTVPSGPHGEAPPVFDGEQASQFELLTAWVEQLAQGRSAPGPTSVQKPPAALLQTGKTTPADGGGAGAASPPPRPAESRAGGGPQRPAYQPRDPFDPEIFNRRFFKEAPP